MNVKKVAIIVSTLLALIGGGYLYVFVITSNVGATETTQCTVDAPVGCDEIIADLQNEHKELQKQQELLSKKADAYRAIARLGTGELK
jgi:hypothetical protein